MLGTNSRKWEFKTAEQNFLFYQDNYSMQKIEVFFFFFTDIAFLDIYSIRKVHSRRRNIFTQVT